MSKRVMFVALAVALMSGSTFGAESVDTRLVGKWQGNRDQSTNCQFLVWNMHFMLDGRFEITFFSDKQRTKKIQTERGTWKASDGKNELRTEGVPKPEIYLYTFIDDNTVKYVNTVRDPSADCQEDYEFTEHRAKK